MSENIYNQHILQNEDKSLSSHVEDKLALSHGVDYDTFARLRTCGLNPLSANINGVPVDPFLSTWFLRGEQQGGDLQRLLGDPSREEYYAGSSSLGEKLCNNLVLLGLNASCMVKMRPWHFFHKRMDKTGEPFADRSEVNLKEYIDKDKCALPFEGAYITDILKFQDRRNSLYIESYSEKVKPDEDALKYNFEVLKGELDLLHALRVDSKMLLVPLGGRCESYLKKFIKWMSEEPRKEDGKWLVVPREYMLHYSPRSWISKNFARCERMKAWCDRLVDCQASPFGE